MAPDPAKVRAADLLRPYAPEVFLDQVYGQRAALLGEPSDRFASLLPWEELESALVHRRVEGLRLRVMRDERPVPAAEYARTLPTRRGGEVTTIRADRVAELLQAGATLAMDDADEFSEPVAGLAAGVERLFRESVTVNAYLSGGTVPGFAVHWDPHDVLAVQVAGGKQWRLYGPTRPAPLVRDYAPAPPPDGPPQQVYELRAGQVLYLPRGWWHAVESVGEPSLHLAFGIRRRTGVDLVEWLADVLRERVEFRRDLPRLDPDGVDSHMAGLKRVLDELWGTDLLRRYLAEDEAGAPVRRRLSLPEVLPGQRQPYAAADTVSLLATRPVVGHRDGRVTLAMDGQSWVFDGGWAPLIELLADGSDHPVSELVGSLAALPRTEAERAVAETLRRLRAAGLVRVIRAAR